MTFKKVRLISFISGGLFLFIDQFLKWQALHTWQNSKLLLNMFGWQPYLNPGIAFSIKIPNNIIILITLPVICLVFYLLLKEIYTHRALSTLALSLVFAGAISNLLDRVLYYKVVDYFLIGWSVFNIADVMIVAGLILYFISVIPAKAGIQSSTN